MFKTPPPCPAPWRRLQEVRPGTEEDDEFAEKIQTVAMSEAISREGERRDPDPDMSLITDFQVITDIRVRKKYVVHSVISLSLSLSLSCV